ncbi:MAG: formate dehydrogenase subunit delta [Alteraurantiacibacter sp. bin_em_oilr2.035]|nr:formate dehydrogenase subunit delta [Alteraurantiacibacter sp. bin_em_oilr2.035]
MSAIGDATVRMANQIARNFESRGSVAAVSATADHIQSFWDPRMKATAFALAENEGSGFSPIARDAIQQLAAGIIPKPQSHATEFNDVDESGSTDAG